MILGPSPPSGGGSRSATRPIRYQGPTSYVVFYTDPQWKANTMYEQHPTRRWRRLALWTVLAAVALVTMAACGAQDDIDETVESSGTTVAAETADTTEPQTADTETTTDEASPEADLESGATDEEPRFELVGELELTTAEINDMVAFVETAAGREFVRPPRIEIQSVEDFEAGLEPDPELRAAVEENAETTARFQQALGFTELGVDDLADVLDTLGSSTDLISGRYDPADDAVYIPEGVLEGDSFNAILVHELLHALDGQHVDLQALMDQLTDNALAEVASDESFSIAAVVEGRATAVQVDWMIANAVVPMQEDIPMSFDLVPPVVINGVVLPYQLGAQTISQLGGAAETWDLYTDFPESSEQMVFPDRIGTDAPQTVPAPAVDGEVFSEGVLGVEGILLLGIGETLQPNQADILRILSAAEGWGGDYYVLTGDEAQSCMTVSYVADTEADLVELDALFTEWASRETTHPSQRSATVEGDTLTISSCAAFIS